MRVHALPAALAVALIVAAAPEDASADFTVAASTGASYVVGGNFNRGPVTFEIGIGWEFWDFLRPEVMIVLGAAGDAQDVWPPQSTGFVGFRPSVKVFPWEGLYGRVATQIFFTEDTYFGLGLGAGYEVRVIDMLGIFGEVTVNPYFEEGSGTPIEGRLGLTLIL